MPITKISPIKSIGSLRNALVYTMNAEKTAQNLFVSAHGTSLDPLRSCYDIFQFDQQYKKSNCSVIAHHLIQAFDPQASISAEMAHKIGMELCENLLKNQYQFVLTTHLDKGHIHNHIIFSSLNMETKRRYRSNKQSYKELRSMSDSICEKYPVPVIEDISQNKGMTYKEHMEIKRGGSWVENARKDIDWSISKANNIDDFLSELKGLGYEIKIGNRMSFRPPGSKKNLTYRTLGEDFTNQKIIERIQTKQPSVQKIKKSLTEVKYLL